MAKALSSIAIGAAIIGADVLLPGVGIMATGLASMSGVGSALLGLGSSFVFGGISSALNRPMGGVAVGTASPIGPWQYVYGTQKVGGILIYQTENSSQGTSNNKELHRVFALACHPCQLGSWQLRIDGKPVPMNPSGSGFASYSPTQITENITSISVSSGVATIVLAAGISGLDGQTLLIRGVADNTLNGTWTVTQPNPSDDTTFTYVCGGINRTSSSGTAKTTYPNYSNKVYVEFTTGTTNSTFAGLLASGTDWNSNCIGLGRTLAYVRLGYDAAYFPTSVPNISFVIEGKNDILDPRTNTRGFTNNAALICADFLSIPATEGGFGLQIGTDIPTASLIAAANICDEAISLAAGGTIPRYTCDTTILCNQGRGQILQQMLTSCAGRLSYQGGTFNVVPGSWVTPSFSLAQSDIISIKGNPTTGTRDSCNAVKGVYISPENNWQQADFPAYQQDSEHGFVSDQYLAQDKGVRLYRDINLTCTNNSATAQRIGKIELMRTRFQGRWTVRCFMSAYQVIALDTIQITFAPLTWVNQTFEVLSSKFVIDKSKGAPILAVELDIALTDPSVYDWTPTEQLTPQGYVQPNNVGNRVCSPPEQVFAYSGLATTINGISVPSTISVGSDGRVHDSIFVGWVTPNDQNVVSGGHIEMQWQLVGSSVWASAGKLDPSATSAYVPNVSDGQSYNIQVRAVNSAGIPSDWVQSTPYPYTVNPTHSLYNVYSNNPIYALSNPSNTAIGLSNVTVQFASNYTANYAARTFSIPVPSGPEWYYVNVYDPTQNGETGPTLTANCWTNNSLVGATNWVYMGAIQAWPQGGSTIILGGGNPAPRMFTTTGPISWPRSHPSIPHPPGPLN